jgi:hypothetical protein
MTARPALGRRILRTLVATLLALTASAVVLPASPADAAGGGCSRWSNKYFEFDACIGDNGVLVAGDVYVKRYVSGCRIELDVIERETGRGITYPSFTCKLGRIGPARYTMRRGYHYHTYVVMTDGLSGHGLTGYSPDSHVP